MINIKSEVVAALKADAKLTALVGDRIYYYYPPVEATYPCISYYELDNRPALCGDNQELASEIVIAVDIWSRVSTSDIADEVDRVMKSLRFMRESASDLYEVDVKIYHKAMRYRILK